MNTDIETVHGTVLITGANRGMGLAYVRHYLREGRAVVSTMRDRAVGRELHRLALEYPDRLTITILDQSSESSIARWRQNLVRSELRFDLVINNAGISQPNGFGEWTAWIFDQHWRTNVVGPALLAQVIAPLLRPGTKLVNISSGMGSLSLNIGANGPLDAYALSKAALNLLTRRLADKLRASNVTVVAINPGWVRTEMGGPEAPTTIESAVREIAGTIETLRPEHSGGFFSSDGTSLPW